MMLNTLIHVFMYYYYYVAAQGKTVWFKKYLTTGQILQFMTAFLVSTPFVYYHFTTDEGCSGFNAFAGSMFVNGSFLALFVRFYKKTYSKPKQVVEKKKL